MALLKIDPGIIIWTWITFLLVLAILGASTWKIILKGLNARADKIQEDLEEAEKTRENAKKSLAAYREQIDNAKVEASAIIENARVEANRIRDKIINNAREEAELNKNKIMSEIDRSKEEAMNSVKKQALDIAVVMAETILKRNINKEDNQALINEFINNANKENSQK
ncbi:F0F1 ATP synthase subunit B [Brachyspira hyodysenteriae]|uniref:ATP synthase subunit b n=2 Tax=Brachyspira hyodysenteriae TaxID=159 RepID=A0A3B6VJ95_BRAHW|nr:F0F1 ATP synthase subunit B [Brachyspira hyodysenteriae]ACN84648.1 putative F0F1-type ATP synthase, subunit B [Brachyspira hyodysenteriae WA1]ANN63277.1 ATP synthase F0 subunit B [Brachyspira hyodysenteriae ATCC 27164]AUJ50383.1 ATP synthase F0 subunit B [Brachyspira hyodysenteriae]KLI14589.1 ATP synthase F0F1 subunit B [Brachyspira hyodysenteriae]KLI23441.1 ATP synthase F0F1 subunit B [Brachyspira hyodysenteriae]